MRSNAQQVNRARKYYAKTLGVNAPPHDWSMCDKRKHRSKAVDRTEELRALYESR